MSIQLKNLKGTSDFMPEEQAVRNEIIKKLREVFERYGYQPLETPVICYFDILSSKYSGGAEILKEVYKFKDQGDREIGLRYDLTIPFSRVVGMNPDLPLPFKRYEIGKVFRNGPVKLGRMREFVQCDVDMVGVKSVMAEAELMTMTYEVYEALGLDIYISYNNRKLLSGIIRAAGIAFAKESSVILSIDKLEKIGESGVRAELTEKSIETENIERLFSYLNKTEDLLLKDLKSNPPNALAEEGLKELDELLSYLSFSKVKNILKFSPTLARGLEIYTGTVFEAFLKDGSITSSVSGGGRYDKVIGNFLNNGKEYPAVGLTFGLDVIFTALSMKGFSDSTPPVKFYLIPIGTKLDAVKILYALRNSLISVDMEMDGRRLRKSLEYANKNRIPYVLILGEDELDKGVIKLRDMNKGTEEELKIADLPINLKSYL